MPNHAAERRRERPLCPHALCICVGGGDCLSSHEISESIAAQFGARFVQTVITGFDRE
jgi:hypothetical protein